MVPDHLKYTEDHEWVLTEGDVATVGITEYATEELGEIVFCELPEAGDSVTQGEEFGSIESVKTVSSLYAPLTGEVVEVNTELADNPSLINDSAFTDGWLIKIRHGADEESDELLTAEEYKTHLESLE